MEHTFTDGIGSIAVGDNVVRIDFVSLSATEKDAEGNPIPVFRQRVVMPIQGFLKLFGHVEQTHTQMQNAGLIAPAGAAGNAPKSQNAPAAAPVTPKKQSLPVKPPVKSPNF